MPFVSQKIFQVPSLIYFCINTSKGKQDYRQTGSVFSFSIRAANIKALLADTIRKRKKKKKTNSRTSLLFRNVAQPSETESIFKKSISLRHPRALLYDWQRALTLSPKQGTEMMNHKNLIALLPASSLTS